jgi:hypothetical protein
VTKPAALLEAELVESLAQRYHRLPSEVAESDVYNLRHTAILALAHPVSEPEADPYA